jgi:hypothetical protein
VTSPADELRAAATKLRETASKATPGPWHTVGLPWNHETPYVVAGHPDPHVGKFVAEVEQVFGDLDEDDRDHAPDAAWVALANPALAEPLAIVLEDAAELYEWALERCHPELREQLEPRVRVQVENELAVARALNGGQS